MIHFNPKLRVRADESRKIQDLIQIESSWVFAVWWFPQWEHKKLVGGTKLSAFQSDKRQLRLFKSLHAAIKNRTEPWQMCFHRRWERGDPVIPPRREMKLAAASLTLVPHLNLRLRLSSLHASARKRGGGVGVALPCGDNYPSGRIWNWENRIKTQNIKTVRWMQHILVRNNCFLLVRINY